MFSIPIAIILFKRKESTLRIIDRIRQIQPLKLYFIADAGRDQEEEVLVAECRRAVEQAVDWPCTVIKNYAIENRGVFAQIGLGANWVFDLEEQAIFLEDDNLPEISFFRYCAECLEKYKNDEKVFWICGTNYLEKCKPSHGASVFASRHLLPCGWASWARKFKKFYDADLELTNSPVWRKELRKAYQDGRLYNQQRRSIESELLRKNSGRRYNSWDFHLALSTRMNDLLGIVPMYNQIQNIGVDEFSTHGGNNFSLEMTRRFCGIRTYPLPEQLLLPASEMLSTEFENRIARIILYPLKTRIILYLREKFNIPEGTRLRYWLLHRG